MAKKSTLDAFLIVLIIQMRLYRDAFLMAQMILVKKDVLTGIVEFKNGNFTA